MILQRAISIEDDSQIGEARRVAAAISSAAGLGSAEAGRVAIVVNELGSNVRKHAARGEIVVRELRMDSASGVELLAIDRGPGMDLEKSLRDGHSTAGTRGEGLGAVRRLAHEFDAYSAKHGTVVLARVWAGEPPAVPVQSGAISVPVPGEQECGDSWELQQGGPLLRFMVVDGLGHGPLAARAATTAVASFNEPSTRRLPGPEAVLHALHAALRSTRGAAIAVAELDLVRRALRFGGIGNIGATLDGVSNKPRGLVSHNGIAGHEARRIQEFEVAWPSHAVLVVHSDGLAGHWKLDGYPGLHARHAAVIAGVLYRDFRRASDDATVLVVKEP